MSKEIVLAEDLELGEQVKEIRVASYDTGSVFIDQQDEMDGKEILATIQIGPRQMKELRDFLTEVIGDGAEAA